MGENDKKAQSRYARIQGFNPVTDEWEAINITSNSAISVEVKGQNTPASYTSATFEYDSNNSLVSAVYYNGTAIVSVLTLTYNASISVTVITKTSATGI